MAGARSRGQPADTFRVLAAYDGSEFGEPIAAILGQIAWPQATRGWVMTVVPPMFVHQLPDWLQPIKRDPDVQAMAEAWQKEHDQQLGAGRRRTAGSFSSRCPASFRAHRADRRSGAAGRTNPGDDHARQKIDLAIVGSRGHGAVERLLIGSTSARVVSDAPCSVLIAR